MTDEPLHELIDRRADLRALIADERRQAKLEILEWLVEYDDDPWILDPLRAEFRERWLPDGDGAQA